MKLILFVFLLLTSTASAATAGGVDAICSPAERYYCHAAAGAIAYSSADISARILDSEHPVLWGLATATAAGLAKEVYDSFQPRDRFDVKGLAATVAGGLVSAGIEFGTTKLFITPTVGGAAVGVKGIF